MPRLHMLDISASALTAERFRMNLVADNIANANSTGGEGSLYQRKVAILAPVERERFATVMSRLRAPAHAAAGGVEVSEVVEDDALPILRYDPEHPDAGADGYVRYPDIDLVREMVDLLSASRSYQANVAAMNTSKELASNALQIGR